MKDQAKDKGSKVSVLGIAMILITSGQQQITQGNHKSGAIMVGAAGVMLLVYEYITDKRMFQV